MLQGSIRIENNLEKWVFEELQELRRVDGRRRRLCTALRAAAGSPELGKLHHADPWASRNTMVHEFQRIDQRIKRKRPLKIKEAHRKTQAHWFFVYRSQSLTKSSKFDPWLSRNVKNTNWRRIDGCFEKNKNFIKVCNCFVVATLEAYRGQFRGR